MPWGYVDSHLSLDFDDMAPVVTKVVEVCEGSAAFPSEVAEPPLGLVEKARVVGKAAVVLNLEISVAQAADAELVQVAVSPVESRLDRQMEFSKVPRRRHDKLAPDRRIDPGQRNPYLQCVRFRGRHRSF